MTAEFYRKQLAVLIRQTCVRNGEFVLKSGAKSSYYLDLKHLGTTGHGLWLAGKVILDHIDYLAERAESVPKVQAIGGPTVGATPFVSAALVQAAQRGLDLRGFMYRADKKDHGTRKNLDGSLRTGDRVVVVEDVITTGRTLLEACAAVTAAGAAVAMAMCLVQRKPPLAELRDAYTYHAVLTAQELGLSEE